MSNHAIEHITTKRGDVWHGASQRGDAQPRASQPSTDAGGCDESATMLDALVTAIAHGRAQIARIQAVEAYALNLALEIALNEAASSSKRSRDADLAVRSVAAMIGAEVRTSDRTIQRQMSEAHVLVTTYPTVLNAMEAGTITRAHAQAIAEAGTCVTDPDARSVFAAHAVEIAKAESVARTRARLAPVAEAAQPTSPEERHGIARQTRHVSIADELDGMSTLTACLPSVFAHGIYNRLSQMARNLGDIEIDCGAATIADPFEHAIDGGADAEEIAAGTSPDTAPGATSRMRARTMNQRRADVLSDLLLTGMPGTSEATSTGAHEGTAHEGTAHDHATALDNAWANVTAHINVTVPVDALTAADVMRAPAGFLDTGALVSPGDARELAGRAAGWDRLFIAPARSARDGDATQADSGSHTDDTARIDGSTRTDNSARPEGSARTGDSTRIDGSIHVYGSSHMIGTVVAVDRYRPSAEQRRFLAARDQHCRFPGCRKPVRHCDIDHTIDAALGGATSIENLAHLCRRHHTLKHATGWTVTHYPGGILEWTSPTGRTHVDRPSGTVIPRHTGVRFTECSPPGASASGSTPEPDRDWPDTPPW